MYQLDAAAAKQADQTGKFIKDTGKYKGKFTKAEAIVAESGTKGISFIFESEAKQQVSFTMYTIKTDGTQLYDYQKLMAIMTCMRIKNVADPVKSKTTKYNFDTKREEEYMGNLLLDLMNRPIGLVLQNCEYEKQKDRIPTGEYAWKLEPSFAFEASTELMASEILGGKTKPEMLGAIMARLTDRPLKNKGNSPKPVQGYQGGTGMPDTHYDDPDIPF